MSRPSNQHTHVVDPSIRDRVIAEPDNQYSSDPRHVSSTRPMFNFRSLEVVRWFRHPPQSEPCPESARIRASCLSWRPIARLCTQDFHVDLYPSAAGLLFALATPTNAQSTLPKDLPVIPAVTILGCVARIQRDGTMSPKTFARRAQPRTPYLRSDDPNPTGFYQLLEHGRLMRGTAKPTSYALTGHEGPSSLEGRRVEVAGCVAPALGDVGFREKMAGAADGAQRFGVSVHRNRRALFAAKKKTAFHNRVAV